MIGLFQFTVTPTTDPRSLGAFNNPIFFWLLLIIITALILVGGLFLIRAILKNKYKTNKAFNRTLIKILVPKERKSEGQGGQISQDDRLDQVKEEIAITETFFSSIAGLKAQSGFKNWLLGRTDHFSFEIVVQNNLIYFVLIY